MGKPGDGFRPIVQDTPPVVRSLDDAKSRTLKKGWYFSMNETVWMTVD
jgi:hypothetical protein